MKVKEIAGLVGGEVDGNEEFIVNQISEVSETDDGSLIFIFDKKVLKELGDVKKRVAAVIPEDIKTEKFEATIRVKNPRMAIVKILNEYYPEPTVNPGSMNGNYQLGDVEMGKDVTIGEFSVICDGTILGDGVSIFPFTYIGHNVKIGEKTKIYPHSAIIDGTVIGNNVIIHSGAVIGSNGFGYAHDDNKAIPIPQVGNVVIEDDVEIGACTMIDRATIGSTRIGKGTKIDNSVHIAHNVKIGSNAIIVAQVGIAGSCKVGNNAVIAGQAGIADHVNIGEGSQVAAKSGVMRDVKDREIVFGYPADRRTRVMRNEAYFRKLPSLFKRVKDLENSK